MTKQTDQSNARELFQTQSLQCCGDQLTTEQSNSFDSENKPNYRRLQTLLQAGNWKEADYETYLAMLRAIGYSEGTWMRPQDLDCFPCQDLCLIDRLWVEWSDQRFGFSIQQRIWHQVGQDYQVFGDRVGWRVEGRWIAYDHLTFRSSAPLGHFPSGWVKDCNLESCVGGCGYVGFEDLFDRLEACSNSLVCT
ncbi:GUN4 domain-containing protein [Phormidesmis sp. 146-33]